MSQFTLVLLGITMNRVILNTTAILISFNKEVTLAQ